jgi:hypothetical protein
MQVVCRLACNIKGRKPVVALLPFTKVYGLLFFSGGVQLIFCYAVGRLYAFKLFCCTSQAYIKT